MTRKNPNFSFKEFKGTLVLKSSMNKLIQILENIDQYPIWLKDCMRLELVYDHKKNLKDFYSVFDPKKTFVSSRDVFFRCKYEYIKNKKNKEVLDYKIKTTFLTEKEARKQLKGKKFPVKVCSDCERMGGLKSLWHLKKIGSNKIKVIYQTGSDPGGWIPIGLANKFAVEQPFHTLMNLKKIAEKK